MGTVGGKAATLRLATMAVENATRGVARAGPFLRQGKQALPLRKITA